VGGGTSLVDNKHHDEELNADLTEFLSKQESLHLTLYVLRPGMLQKLLLI
jgi:hypothetical protein